MGYRDAKPHIFTEPYFGHSPRFTYAACQPRCQIIPTQKACQIQVIADHLIGVIQQVRIKNYTRRLCFVLRLLKGQEVLLHAIFFLTGHLQISGFILQTRRLFRVCVLAIIDSDESPPFTGNNILTHPLLLHSLQYAASRVDDMQVIH